ncbi:hypothetical protein D7M11_28175 [Paenibacillus ginsengarvi]|uniref:Uncharacterized protein n=1 Tax=Paenibacillus ginsengarvi TaxID=400777 RepID=A0A3B0BLV4_9BACL|nr:hypothetical protein D7M11_28175 [Paenibacillus ginsengarvi]
MTFLIFSSPSDFGIQIQSYPLDGNKEVKFLKYRKNYKPIDWHLQVAKYIFMHEVSLLWADGHMLEQGIDEGVDSVCIK